MLRTILVALDESPWSESATTLALEWADRFGARPMGLAILDKPTITAPQPVPLGASDFKKERDEELLRDARQRVHAVLARFLERCVAARVEPRVVEAVGDPTDCILHYAHRCDVVILGRETHFHFETQDEADATLAQVLRASPRPVVTVPKDLIQGNGIVVAYGGGREVARTLQVFQLLGLAGNETIHLVGVTREDRQSEVLAPFAAEFLEAHGAKHKLHIVESSLDPATAILDQVRSLRPRLLVMGAHGHHPVRDLFFNSVTRAVLKNCPTPVLIGA